MEEEGGEGVARGEGTEGVVVEREAGGVGEGVGGV